jgi:hypothetical protein
MTAANRRLPEYLTQVHESATPKVGYPAAAASFEGKTCKPGDDAMPLNMLISVAITLAFMAFMFWMAFNDADAELGAGGEAADEERPRAGQPVQARAAQPKRLG